MPASRSILIGWLIADTTNYDRLRAGLPGRAEGDKIGNNGADAAIDLGIAWVPRVSIMIAVFTRGSSPTAAQFKEVSGPWGSVRHLVWPERRRILHPTPSLEAVAMKQSAQSCECPLAPHRSGPLSPTPRPGEGREDGKVDLLAGLTPACRADPRETLVLRAETPAPSLNSAAARTSQCCLEPGDP